MTIVYENILGIEVKTITQYSGLVEEGWGGFHSDYENEFKKTSIVEIKSEVMDKKQIITR